MKTVTIKNYIQGLASFLDEQNIKWERTGKEDQVKIYFKDEEELFRFGWMFGRFYERMDITVE